MDLDFFRDVILDEVPDELLSAEKTFETCIMGIGYLKCHLKSVGQESGVGKDSSQAECQISPPRYKRGSCRRQRFNWVKTALQGQERSVPS